VLTDTGGGIDNAILILHNPRVQRKNKKVGVFMTNQAKGNLLKFCDLCEALLVFCKNMPIKEIKQELEFFYADGTTKISDIWDDYTYLIVNVPKLDC